MDLRDDTHTQLKDVISTLRVIAKLEPPSPVVMDELKRWCEQAATLLDVFILPTIKPNPPYLDLRTGILGNGHKVVAEYAGATSQAAAEADAVQPEPVSSFMPAQRNGSR